MFHWFTSLEMLISSEEELSKILAYYSMQEDWTCAEMGVEEESSPSAKSGAYLNHDKLV